MPNSAWSSDRLVYRAIEERDGEFVHQVMTDGEHDYLTGMSRIPQPLGTSMGKRFLEVTADLTLAVMVCLPVEAEAGPASESEASAKPKTTETIGWISLVDSDPMAPNHRGASLGIWIWRKYQGKGYGSEAIKWCLNWGFYHANLHRIELDVNSWNESAHRLYQSLGFVDEGRKRESIWRNGKYRDTFQMSMLEHEWRARYMADEGEGEGGDRELPLRA